MNAQQLHRLVRSITNDLGAGLPPSEQQGARERLVGFAVEHRLDLQDFGTLIRVASGEGWDEPTDVDDYHRRMQQLQAERAALTQSPTESSTPS